MNALTAVTATFYAIALWMFAPRSIWDKELATAKQNQQNRLNPIPEPIPDTVPTPIQETTPEPSAQPLELTPEPVPTPEPITEPIPDTQPIEPDTIPTPEPLNLETFTTTQLREIAKKQKLNWRPLVNGKRTPLKKPDLIQLLTA
jgi:outer membrane biosynthesis protein TonB